MNGVLFFSRKVRGNLRESGEVEEGREGREVSCEVVEESEAIRDMFCISLISASTTLWFWLVRL